VRRSSVQHGGKPIKWLGDRVMFYFPDPGPGVRAALEMVDALGAEGVAAGARRPCRGAGPVPGGRLLRPDRELSARIADYARQGEVLVSRAVADASQGEEIAFADIGAVELKGLSGTLNLLRAQSA
jgi:class 3 adenylate cyclase